MSRAVITCTWDDVPHITPQMQAQMMADLPEHVIETRRKGIPRLGSGAIYPIAESRFVIDPIHIPAHWPRAFGFDAGWHNTAAIWGAWDKDSDVVYLYSEHLQHKWAVPLHAAALKARGRWIPGVGDAAATDQSDGKQLIKMYRGEGVNLRLAQKQVEAGIQAVYGRLVTGRLKIFQSLEQWLKEYRLYRYDEKTGKPVKTNDHLMDATRYLIMSGLKRAKTKIQSAEPDAPRTKERLMGWSNNRT